MAAFFSAEEAGQGTAGGEDTDDDHGVAVSLGFMGFVVGGNEHWDDGRAEQEADLAKGKR